MSALASAPEVVAFWRDAGADRWFQGGAAFDDECRERCADLHHAAARREQEDWLASPEGALALVLLLDQIPRNIFRNSGHAFATDPLARHYAVRAVESGFDTQVDPELRIFFYMPFEHSEERADQDRAVALIEPLQSEMYTKYAHAHRDVIVRFGRFPHRNRALGRDSTAEEQGWLDAGGGF